MAGPSTLLDKIWRNHVVCPETDDTPAVLYIDLHLIHEITSPQAFTELQRRGLRVRRPDRTLATMDHAVPTTPRDSHGKLHIVDPQAIAQLGALKENCAASGIELYDTDSPHQGIVHVVGPERGRSQPGMTIVCGDSHTSTHGAFGALAFGIGTTEVGHVLATQTLLQRKPKSLAIEIDGALGQGVSAKDLVLAVIGHIGVDGGRDHVLEFRGSAVRALSMEGRMTVCNMSIEAGARAGMVAPDDTTLEYMSARLDDLPDSTIRRWRDLVGDDGCVFDSTMTLDAASISPMITYGTHPGMVIGLRDAVPAATTPEQRRAIDYMQVAEGKPLLDTPVDVVFVGSCTNSRITDLREAAQIMRGRTVAAGVRTYIVPGSQEVKRQAEAEGLDEVFRQAGADWREPGCSMCIALNGDVVAAGELAVSTSNRNFEGRQGTGARTILASPITAAACAVAGKITDPRRML